MELLVRGLGPALIPMACTHRSMGGVVYYAALYEVALKPEEIITNTKVLMENDDDEAR